MPTERQSESARINGAKSHGPKSAEGKEKSSRNSLRHGCTAHHTLLLACEDRGEFDKMRDKYNAMHKPVTLEEQDLVDEMISARWRILRALSIEVALIDTEMVTEEPKLKQKFVTIDTGMVLSSAFRTLADESRSTALLSRYESRLRRIHKQAHAMLLRVQELRQSVVGPAILPASPLSGGLVCAPPTPTAPPPEAIPLIPKPEARCSPEKIRVVQADSLPPCAENKRLQNEPATQRFLRRFRSRKARKIFNAANRQAARC
jgi:hypothetical protein